MTESPPPSRRLALAADLAGLRKAPPATAPNDATLRSLGAETPNTSPDRPHVATSPHRQPRKVAPGERPTKPNLPVMLTATQRDALDDETSRDVTAASIVRALLTIMLGDPRLKGRALTLARADTRALRDRKP